MGLRGRSLRPGAVVRLAVRWQLLFLCCSAPLAEAGGDLFRLVKRIKPQAILADGKKVGKAVQEAAGKAGLNKDAASQALGEVSKVAKAVSSEDALSQAGPAGKAVVKEVGNTLSHTDVGEVLKADAPQVAKLKKEIDKVDVRKVQTAIQKATPKIAEVLKRTDPEQFAEALRMADPKELEMVIHAVSVWRWWRLHWPQLALIGVALVSLTVLSCRAARRACRRQKHKSAGLSDEKMLEVGEPLFARAELSESLA